jgi:DNA invertase Pin-like site-specific DNA recombinase
MFGMCAVFAALEVDLLRKRTRTGLAAARRRGARIGRPRRLSEVDCARVHRLRGSGKSLGEIAELLGVSKSTVSRELRRAAARCAA